MACATYEAMLEPVIVDDPSEICMLGRRYGATEEERADFRRHVRDLLWFTYRRSFKRIGTTSIQTDSGWGCTLRCGQMLLAEALLRYYRVVYPEEERALLRRTLLRFFEDNEDAQYSIHNIAKAGTKFHKRIGEWFGPTTVVQVLRCLLDKQQAHDVVAHVCMDGLVCIDDIVQDCTRHGTFKPLLLLIPLRLGLDRINEQYHDSLKRVFTFPETVGIIGGKPDSAFYFVGAQDDKLIYLDPHTTQLTLSIAENPSFSEKSFSCKDPHWMHISSLDPSMCLGFFCASKPALDELLARFHDFHDSPLFAVTDTSAFTSALDKLKLDESASADGADAVLSSIGDSDDGEEDDDFGFELI